MALPPASGAFQVTTIWVLVGTSVGASGWAGTATGVPVAAADQGPLPTSLVARTCTW